MFFQKAQHRRVGTLLQKAAPVCGVTKYPFQINERSVGATRLHEEEQAAPEVRREHRAQNFGVEAVERPEDLNQLIGDEVPLDGSVASLHHQDVERERCFEIACVRHDRACPDRPGQCLKDFGMEISVRVDQDHWASSSRVGQRDVPQQGALSDPGLTHDVEMLPQVVCVHSDCPAELVRTKPDHVAPYWTPVALAHGIRDHRDCGGMHHEVRDVRASANQVGKIDPGRSRAGGEGNGAEDQRFNEM
jgi:hypothetical protein